MHKGLGRSGKRRAEIDHDNDFDLDSESDSELDYDLLGESDFEDDDDDEDADMFLGGGRKRSGSGGVSLKGKMIRDRKIFYDETYVGPVRDQGDCGSCYAMATTTAVTGSVVRRHEILHKEKILPEVLSPQMINDCSNGLASQD